MKQWIFSALLVTISAFSTVQAEPATEGSVEVGPYVGYTFLDDYAALNPDSALHYGGRFGYFITDNFSIEPSFQVLLSDTAANNRLKIYSTRFNLLYGFIPGGRINPFVTMGLGWEYTDIASINSSHDLGLNGGAGIRFMINDRVGIRLDGRAIYSEVTAIADKRTYNYEGNLGVSFFFGGKPPKDTDGDGVPDKKDQCPATPPVATVDLNGCPSDSDGDKVLDGLDKCPGTAANIKVDSFGCPVDTDGDGVADSLDKCPDTLKGVSVDQAGCTIDSDEDGVADPSDQCPDSPKGIPVDAKGCTLDSDGDGISDDKDKCPNTPKETVIDTMGCPKVTKARGVLKGVNFQFGSAKLRNESFKVLDEVAAALNEFPEVQAEVQGHTDNVGPKEANTRISQARAEAVREYLVSKGVASNRLEAKGYGPDQPLGSNKTKAGKAQNRRVELKWKD